MSSDPPPRRWYSYPLRALAVLVFGVLLFAFSIWIAAFKYQEGRAAEARRVLIDLGIPDDMEAYRRPEIEYGENAAIHYRDATRRFGEVTNKEIALIPIRQAYEIEQAQYFVLDDTHYLPMTNVDSVAPLGKFLGEELILRAKNGKTDDAWFLVAAGLRAANSLTQDRTHDGVIVRNTIAGDILQASNEIVLYGLPPDAIHEAIVLELDQLRDWTRMQQAVAWEATLMLDLWEEGDAYVSWTLIFYPLFLGHRTEQYENFRILYEAAGAPYHAHANILSSRTLNVWGITLRSSQLPTTLIDFNDIAARCDMLEITLALEEYKAANHAYPETLAELIPQYLREVPVDPFSGEAYHYLFMDNGFTLHSVGIDGQSQGGKANDIVWSVRQPRTTNSP